MAATAAMSGNIPSPTISPAAARKGNLAALHPTVKPVALVADAILDCSARGDIVLEPFLGSGTTLIAAERVGRRCCGIELDPLYVDTAIRRWQRSQGTAPSTPPAGGALMISFAMRGCRWRRRLMAAMRSVRQAAAIDTSSNPDNQAIGAVGRPGAENLATTFEEALKRRVIVTENGRRKRAIQVRSHRQAAGQQGCSGRPQGDPAAAERDPSSRKQGYGAGVASRASTPPRTRRSGESMIARIRSSSPEVTPASTGAPQKARQMIRRPSDKEK